LIWNSNQASYLLLTLALTVFAVAPLAYPGYFQVHSGFIPVYNLVDLGNRAFEWGWTPSVAITFDPLRGDGLLPYYLGLPAARLDGVKIVFALSFLLGAAGVYTWLRRRLGPAGAALAALVYTYLPYHLVAVYVRGAWGEALFLGLLPWAMAAARPRKSAETSEILVMALVWALLGLSQPGLAMWAFLLLTVWAVWVDHHGPSETSGDHKGRSETSGDRQGRPYTSLLAALGGLVLALTLIFLAGGFSFPASPVNFFDHFLYPAQLFSATRGFGASRPGWDDGLALGLGFAAVGLGMLTLILAAATRTNRRNEPRSKESPPDPWRVFGLIVALTLLTLSPSAFVWRLTWLDNVLTYPWQLLGLVGLPLSVLAGASVKLDRRLGELPAFAGLIVLTLLASYSYLEPRFTQQPPGNGPLAAWDEHHLLLLDYDLSSEIPSAAAGLSESTGGRVPLADSGTPRPGDTLHLTVTWQATRPFDRDLKLFAHLLDASGQVIAQADPLAGLGAGPDGEGYFTSQWVPGELILDDVAIAIPPDAPPGAYRLAFGLYDGETLERLPVVGQEDARVLVEVGSRE